jgi:uncharacterized protein
MNHDLRRLHVVAAREAVLRCSKGMDPRTRITQALHERSDVVFALLFGSRARGLSRPDSDWDLAVYLVETLNPAARFAIRRDLAASLEPALRVDIVVLNDAPPLLAHRALMGELLLDRDHDTYVRFFVRTVGVSLDQAHARKIHADARRLRLMERPRG